MTTLHEWWEALHASRWYPLVASLLLFLPGFWAGWVAGRWFAARAWIRVIGVGKRKLYTPPASGKETTFGFPVIIDETMPSDQMSFVNRAGCEVARITDIAPPASGEETT